MGFFGSNSPSYFLKPKKNIYIVLKAYIKVENYKFLKSYIKKENYEFEKYKSRILQNKIFLKAYIKMEKVIKSGDIETKNQKCHQYKKPISIKSININKITESNQVPFGKKGFKYYNGYKDAKKIDLYGYLSPKWFDIEKTLMKLNLCLFW